MHVLILGWELPPEISGGLGTACHGLTKALVAAGVQVTFVMPRSGDADSGARSADTGAAYLSLETPEISPAQTTATGSGQPAMSGWPGTQPGLEQIRFVPIDSGLRPYLRPGLESALTGWCPQERLEPTIGAPAGQAGPIALPADTPPECEEDLFAAVERFTRLAVRATSTLSFDLVHAHDWMTFPAGGSIASALGKPLVVHVHSTEFDRSGGHIDQRIYDIERTGMHLAGKVVAVSFLTRGICIRHYGLDRDKIQVVYNALDEESFAGTVADRAAGDLAVDDQAGATVSDVGGRDLLPISAEEKIVLFLGRITVQKGPEYFLAAARKVLEVYKNVRFVMAGSGDMMGSIARLAIEMGIGDKVLFTGFLRADDVARMFRCADLYVMPSVSEPFGIAPLEAISFDVPVLMSKQSGAGEVLRHVLKADFWDIEEMANKIVAVLRHPPLHAMLKAQAGFEVRRLTWSDSADRCIEVYHELAGRSSAV